MRWLTVPSENYPEDSRELRLQAIIDNAEWLQENDMDENRIEAAKMLGCMKGDVNALIDTLGGDSSE